MRLRVAKVGVSRTSILSEIVRTCFFFVLNLFLHAVIVNITASHGLLFDSKLYTKIHLYSMSEFMSCLHLAIFRCEEDG